MKIRFYSPMRRHYADALDAIAKGDIFGAERHEAAARGIAPRVLAELEGAKDAKNRTK